MEDLRWTTFAYPLVAYFFLHILLFIHTLCVPESILRGDRANQRLATIEVFVDAPEELPQLLLQIGLPGDWLAHGLTWLLGGPVLVVLMQMALGAATVTASVGLARGLGASGLAATMAGMLTAALPGGIMNAHLLVTENWFTAPFALGLWALVEAVRRERALLAIVGIILLGVAALIRPQGMVLAPVALVVLWILVPRVRMAALAGTLIAMVIMPGLWLGWRYFETGEMGLGQSSFDVARNLALRAERALRIANLDPADIASFVGSPRLSLNEFMAIASQYPLPTVRSYLNDAINLAFNPGANHLFGHYLNLIHTPGMSDVWFWTRVSDQQGWLGIIHAIFNQGIGLILTLLLMGAIHALALFGAVAGLWRLIAAGTTKRRCAALLVCVISFAFVITIFIAADVRWSHRSAIEPVIAALAGIGLCWVFNRWGGRSSTASMCQSGGVE